MKLQQKTFVLHIEDDDEVANATGGVLKLLNPTWHIERVDNPDAALDLLKANPEKFKLVILDLRLPGGYSGLEVLKLIVDLYPYICVVIYSATDDPDMEERAFHIGAQSYIYKPCDGRELYKKLNRAVVRFYGVIERCAPKVVEELEPSPKPPLFDRNAKIAIITTAIAGGIGAFITGFWDVIKVAGKAIWSALTKH